MVADGNTALHGWAMFTGGGLAVLLLNVIHRFGVTGNEDRDREEAARAYFDEHGEWPEEEERPAGRKWRLPAGVATPESEREEKAGDRTG